MSCNQILVLFGFLVVLNVVLSARILGVFPTPSISHHGVFQPIIRELAKRGHELTIITTDPMKDPSLKTLREIDVGPISYEIWRNHSIATLGTTERLESTDISSFVAVFDVLIEAQIRHPEVMQMITDKSVSFDLLIVEFLYPSSYAFKHRFQCPMVGISSMPLLLGNQDVVGNPSHPALYPDYNLPFSNTLSFFERVASLIFSVSYRIYGLTQVAKIDKCVKKYFGEDMPSVKALAREVSLVLSNVNPVLSPKRPNVPAHIEINGVHIREPQELPKDLKEYLDSSKNGVIYVSFGSNVKSSLLPKSKIETLLNVFRELPYNFIWKFEADNLPNIPKNLQIMKWTPQQELLRHPNVKVFVFQGGLQSLEESVYGDVPVVVVPFFGDQHGNAKKVVESGVGLSIDFLDVTKDKLKAIILEVAENKKYKEKTVEFHTIAIDQPMTGLEKSVWWIEYVIRHKGAKHLQNPAVKMPLYEYFMLDVFAFLFVIIFVVIYVLYKLIALLLRMCCRSKQKND